MKGMLTRLSSAIIFVAVMLGGLYGGRYSFMTLFTLVALLCLWEFLNLVLAKHSRRDLIRIMLGIAMGVVPIIITAILQLDLFNRTRFVAVSALLFFPFVFLAFIYELYSRSATPFQNIGYLLLGMIYIGIPFSLLNFIAFDNGQFYANIVLGLLLLTWMNDTGAYVVGSLFGKHPLLPRISPKKTWEGTIGGIIITMAVSAALALLPNSMQLHEWMVLGLIVSVFGGIGDLVESMLKRSRRVKDSGSLLPGHGGLLDRFDAFIFLLPYAAAYILLIR